MVSKDKKDLQPLGRLDKNNQLQVNSILGVSLPMRPANIRRLRETAGLK